MRTAAEDIKQEDSGRSFFNAPDPRFEFMSNNFRIYKSMNDSWVDFLRKSVQETASEHAGQGFPWSKAMEEWQQFPTRILHHSISFAAAMKEVVQHSAGGQKAYTDLGIARLDCLQKISQAFREAKRNGNGASDAWICCLKASEELVGAEMSFLEERVKALFQLSSVMVSKKATAEKKEFSKVKEEKASKT